MGPKIAWGFLSGAIRERLSALGSSMFTETLSAHLAASRTRCSEAPGITFRWI